MAGDWIKFEVTTPDKPEVVQMAAILQIDQDAVVGKLLRVWAWADQNTIVCNGECNGLTVTRSFIDRMTFCPGFALAMQKVGWLIGEENSFTFPNFVRHNGKTAKERAVSNKRVAQHRSSNGKGNDSVTESVTVGVTQAPLQIPLPEKRREEKAIPPISPRKGKTGKCTFEVWVGQQDGDELIRADDPIFRWAEDVGVPKDWMALAWEAFCDLYGKGGLREKKRYDNWPGVFRNAVKDDWLKVWRTLPDGQIVLTTVGEQLRRKVQAEANRMDDAA